MPGKPSEMPLERCRKTVEAATPVCATNEALLGSSRLTAPLTRSDGYTAKRIRVLDEAEIAARFGWAHAGQLAERYRHVPQEFIARMLEACRLSGMACELAIARYLDGDRSVGVTSEFMAAHSELADARRHGR